MAQNKPFTVYYMQKHHFGSTRYSLSNSTKRLEMSFLSAFSFLFLAFFFVIFFFLKGSVSQRDEDQEKKKNSVVLLFLRGF